MNNYTNGLEARIELLLDRYYEGETTPDEELELYALLIDVQEGERHYADAVLLRSQFEHPVERPLVPEPSPAAHPIFLSRRWLWPASMAAALMVVALGLWLYHSEDHASMMAQRNGAEMTQEEVNVVVDDAVMRLACALDNSNAKSQQVLMLLEKSLK